MLADPYLPLFAAYLPRTDEELSDIDGRGERPKWKGDGSETRRGVMNLVTPDTFSWIQNGAQIVEKLICIFDCVSPARV